MKGRREKYTEKIVQRILSLIREDTFTIAEICKQVGIGERTYYDWQSGRPEFAEAVEAAKEACTQKFIQEAKNSLRKKVKGFDTTETRVVTVPNKNDPSKPMIKEQITTKKYIPPDTTAIIFTLTNLDPANWKNKHSAEITGKDGKDLFKQISDEELDKEIAALENKLKQKE